MRLIKFSVVFLYILINIIFLIKNINSESEAEFEEDIPDFTSALKELQGAQTIESITSNLPQLESLLMVNSSNLLGTIHTILPRLKNLIFNRKYENLRQYNVSPNMTISGISAGGAFGMMLAFIHSSFVKGAGIFAGAPFPTGIVALTQPWNIFNPYHYYKVIDSYARRGLIDDPSNIANNSGVYLHRGIFDYTPIFFTKINAAVFKRYGMKPSSVHYVSTTLSGHCIPIHHGKPLSLQKLCPIGDIEAICDCNYQSIFDMLSQLYPKTWKVPSSTNGLTTGRIFKFNQTEFLPHMNAFKAGWWDFGWAYVPKRCESGEIQCTLHMGFHGCGQNDIKMFLGLLPGFIDYTGYMQAADANDIIMVFPQARITVVTGSIGCFDIYGFTSIGRNTYATRNGVQPAAIKKMFDRIVYGK